MTLAGIGQRGLPLLRRYAVPLGLILLCLALMAFSIVRLTAVSRNMQINAAENMLWVISQTEAEALKLEVAIALVLLEEADERALNLRYDLLLSRLSLLTEGPQTRYLAALGRDTAIVVHRAEVLAADPLIAPIIAGDAETASELRNALTGLRTTLGPLVTDTMVTDWQALAVRLDQHRIAIGKVVASVFGVIGSLLFLGQRVIADRQRLMRAELEKLRLMRLETELQAERMKSEHYRDFAAVISHQFRTPLAIIDSSMQRLVRIGGRVTAADVEARQAGIRKATARLLRLIDVALLAGHPDERKIAMALRDCDIGALVADLCVAHRSLHPERQILCDGAAGQLNAFADPGLVAHVLENLLSNAIKYSPDDAPVICRIYNEGGRIACSVTDSGPGLGPDITRLFDKFARGAAARDIPGSGLGLHVAQRLAQMQGGTVTAGKRDGAHGAVFTLWLPSTKTMPSRDETMAEEAGYQLLQHDEALP